MDDRQPVRMPLAEAAEYVHRLIVSCVPSWPKDISCLIATYVELYKRHSCTFEEVNVDSRGLRDYNTPFAVDGDMVVTATNDKRVYLLPICGELPSYGTVEKLRRRFKAKKPIGKLPTNDHLSILGLYDGTYSTESGLAYVKGGKLIVDVIHAPVLAEIDDNMSGIVRYDRHGHRRDSVYPVKFDRNYRVRQFTPTRIYVERMFGHGWIVTGLAHVDTNSNVTAYHSIYECGGGYTIIKQKSIAAEGEVTITIFAAGLKKCSFSLKGVSLWVDYLEIFTDKERPVFYIWRNDGKRLEKMTRYTITESYRFL